MNFFLHYYPGELSLARVKAFLVKAHEVFVDVLRPLENVADYAKKLQSLAHAIVCVDENGIWQGACFGYCNDPHAQRAYVTFISKCNHRAKGVGTGCLNAFCDFAYRGGGVQLVELEVDIKNVTAQKFYAKMGFHCVRQEGHSYFLGKRLPENLLIE